MGFLNIRNIEISLKELERKYSSRLSKKIKALIFDPEAEEDECSNTYITDSLQELEEHMDRVLTKAQKLNSTTMSPSQDL